MSQLRRIARNCTNLLTITQFYESALGFAAGPITANPALATALNIQEIQSTRLNLGAQQLELTQCSPPGAPYPAGAQANDIFFQHIAIVTTNIAAAAARAIAHGAIPISRNGPQQLPLSSGGVIAWKFRDPDGHPLELLQFPRREAWRGDALFLGYDHSAIAVADAKRAIAFYNALGLNIQQRQINHGPEQDRLDALDHALVDVIALMPPAAPPHLELLAYGNAPRPATDIHANDIAADRLLFESSSNAITLSRDPDGHFLQFGG
jgi:catechol 2,3-dioxygenase-like lactoylglutathione lyase family enzyme